MPDGSVGFASWRADIATAPMQAFAHRPGTTIHAVLVDRDAVSAVGGFDPGLRTCEDWDLWQRLAQAGARFVGLPEVLAFYRTGVAASLSRGHRQMLQDGVVVIRRGFERLGNAAVADWRLPATHLALWCAAAEAGAGRDGVALMKQGAPDLLLDSDFDAISKSFLDGLAVGAAVVPAALVRAWPRLGPMLAPVVEWVGRTAGIPGLTRRLTHALEFRLLENSALAAPTALSLVIGTRVQLRRPAPLLPPPNVDMALVRLCDGPRVLGTVQVPLVGPLAGREVAALAVEALGGRALWRAGVARRPQVLARALWEAVPLALHAVAARLAPPRVTASRRGLRAQAKLALARAIVAAAGPESDGQVRVPILHRAAAKPLPAEVARQVAWGGVTARRCGLRGSAATDRVPVLAYHRIAEDGPPGLTRYRIPPARFEAQLRLLRRHGYHPISSAELGWFIGARHPLPGRPVLITFDDGYMDFREAAWPILRANDFTAEVFMPTDLVGGAADWDAEYGPPAPLLGWEDAAALTKEGVVFGSHLASHADGLALPAAALAEELVRSRAVLEARLGQDVRAYAAPYGALDKRFARLAARCGYRIGFSMDPAQARLTDPPLMLPRIEVRGEWDLDTFAAALEFAR
jgi:peptidoglycan/xylan/chitin deacetylase (PgdA/CDA1 family)